MKNLSTQISFQPSMNEPHNGGRESRMCGGPVKVTTGTLRRQTVSPRQPPPQSTHHPSMTRLHPPPPHTHTPTHKEQNVLTAADSSCPSSPLLSSPFSLRTCLPCCHAREKEHRHHFDCSSQPRHCRSTVCQAHSLLVSKISHSGQGNCRA